MTDKKEYNSTQLQEIYTSKIVNIVKDITRSKNSINVNLKKNNLTQNIKGKKIIIKDPDFYDANISKFLLYLNSTKGLPNSLRIVCHSKTMKDFYKQLKLENVQQQQKINFGPGTDGFFGGSNKKVLTPIESLQKKENLWSLFIEYNCFYKLNNTPILKNKFISISRHGYTFANLIKNKGGITSGIKQSLETDTRLSVFGILTSLLHGNDLIENEIRNGLNDSPHNIFVSILSRTWMTAICLYLPHVNFKSIGSNFTLIVSPFIKEKGLGYDNYPEAFEKQIENIKIFLKFILQIENYFEKNKSLLEIKEIQIIYENTIKIRKYIEKRPIIIYGVTKKSITQKIKNRIFGSSERRISYIYRKAEIKYENEIFISNIIDNESYYKKRDNTCSTCSKINIKTAKIFHGELKPNKKKAKTIFTRWCEPLSDKRTWIYKPNKLCKIKLNKLVDLSSNETVSLINNKPLILANKAI